MTVSIVSPAERHAERVAQVLATAASWVQVQLDGSPVWLIPSQSNDGSYEVDQHGCSCPDFTRRLECAPAAACKHMHALTAFLARQPQTAPRECGICDRAHQCHCDRLQAWCSRCVGVA